VTTNNTQLFAGWVQFLSPNQQYQSTEEKLNNTVYKSNKTLASSKEHELRARDYSSLDDNFYK